MDNLIYFMHPSGEEPVDNVWRAGGPIPKEKKK